MCAERGKGSMFKNEYLKRVYEQVEARNKGEAEFLQAVREVLESL